MIFKSIAALAASVASPADAPPGALSCSGCHAETSSVATPVPGLIGRPAEDIVAAFKAFRSGERQGTIMDRIAKGFSDGEIEAIAKYYAARHGR